MSDQILTPPKYMSARKFSMFIGLSYYTVLKMVKQGELIGFKAGKTYFILVESYKDLAHPMISE